MGKIIKLIKKKLIFSNKGFSLTELIISIAILGLISTVMVSLMTVGGTTFSKVNFQVNMQYDSQIALAQMGDYIIDCNNEISWSEGVLTVTTTLDDGSDDSTIFTLHNNKIFYSKGATADDYSIVVENVSSLDITINSEEINGAKIANSITMTLVLEGNGDSHTATQTISLRNKPITN